MREMIVHKLDVVNLIPNTCNKFTHSPGAVLRGVKIVVYDTSIQFNTGSLNCPTGTILF